MGVGWGWRYVDYAFTLTCLQTAKNQRFTYHKLLLGSTHGGTPLGVLMGSNKQLN